MTLADEHTDRLAASWIKHFADQARLASAFSTDGRLFVQLYRQEVHGMASLPNES
jgi:hypothetical protein